MNSKRIDLECKGKEIRLIILDDLINAREDFLIDKLQNIGIILAESDESGNSVKDYENRCKIIRLYQLFKDIIEQETKSISKLRAGIIHNLQNT